MTFRFGLRVVGILALLCFASKLFADDIQLGATFVCNGERLYVEDCNLRGTSDSSTCMVAHPNRPQRNGLMVYTYETRGTLKKLLPICKQPSSEEVRETSWMTSIPRCKQQSTARMLSRLRSARCTAASPWGEPPNFVPVRSSKISCRQRSICCSLAPCTTVNRWDKPIQLKMGNNSLTLSQANASVLNENHGNR